MRCPLKIECEATSSPGVLPGFPEWTMNVGFKQPYDKMSFIGPFAWAAAMNHCCSIRQIIPLVTTMKYSASDALTTKLPLMTSSQEHPSKQMPPADTICNVIPVAILQRKGDLNSARIAFRSTHLDQFRAKYSWGVVGSHGEVRRPVRLVSGHPSEQPPHETTQDCTRFVRHMTSGWLLGASTSRGCSNVLIGDASARLRGSPEYETEVPDNERMGFTTRFCLCCHNACNSHCIRPPPPALAQHKCARTRATWLKNLLDGRHDKRDNLDQLRPFSMFAVHLLCTAGFLAASVRSAFLGLGIETSSRLFCPRFLPCSLACKIPSLDDSAKIAFEVRTQLDVFDTKIRLEPGHFANMQCPHKVDCVATSGPGAVPEYDQWTMHVSFKQPHDRLSFVGPFAWAAAMNHCCSIRQTYPLVTTMKYRAGVYVSDNRIFQLQCDPSGYTAEERRPEFCKNSFPKHSLSSLPSSAPKEDG
ncbi:hypothetical protein E5Q_05346 [Mixia osmundae IAM 14324]|uniref:Uncharacterized protein n=2 Tax=Mixia osmundae (strain CBS 9802 / IAM 14324 / JCM 22182 / KY 12970) TaxID=764103 RepID=G7E748_MIXOS|nr:hypothetical protein E5Q_05346 [Mixia osmundae IAM 14324]